MKLVSGKYLTFVDSDDYIEKELFANAKKIIDETRAHLVKYSVVEQYYDIDQNYIGKRNVVLRDKVYHTKMMFVQPFCQWKNYLFLVIFGIVFMI